jgi:transposase-like protein
MGKSRQTISPETKAKIALEAIRGLVTINELAAKYKVHPNLISKWKKQATDNMASLFADGRAKIKRDDSAETIERLYREVGQLQCDLSWLKKKHQIDD